MRREFPTSICAGWAKPPLTPQYRKASLLNIVRAERRIAVKMRKIQGHETRERIVESLMQAAEVEASGC